MRGVISALFLLYFKYLLFMYSKWSVVLFQAFYNKLNFINLSLKRYIFKRVYTSNNEFHDKLANFDLECSSSRLSQLKWHISSLPQIFMKSSKLILFSFGKSVLKLTGHIAMLVGLTRSPPRIWQQNRLLFSLCHWHTPIL